MSGLRVKDILLDPSDFDPTTLYTPNVISHENEIWKAALSADDFKTFWHRERTAIQFVHRTEGGCNHGLLKGSPDSQLPTFRPVGYGGSVGAPKRNDWSFRFSCRRHKRPTKLTITRDSVGAACPVEIRMTKPVGKEVVNVSYKWRHSHDDSGSARSRIPLGRNERTWTAKQARSGMKWAAIKALLNCSKDPEKLKALLLLCTT
ncbi:hypothetical protein BC939DRAFT_456824 [Gamsiella multidivaricata]|uniref:uncharacterized protein n=1 Tax=Gamsiella multidivaricata TaxID=101098 RepID=UPI00221F5EEA|nr:uncharacterized protein BC939DRAFT_456824 [Gamsiella multidivaricata]KAI7821003.1 hypothetical protein BC939DRAFT_456824 [Gamsiella multidivaricata]